MFTGIVEEVGTVVARRDFSDAAAITVQGPRVVEGTELGDSIAVNGVCLTVADKLADGFVADVMAETLARSSLSDVHEGDRVNLERALPVNGRLGGHVVQGHVDGTAQLLLRMPGERWDVLRFTLPDDVNRYLVHKGSITVDGVSLTVSARGHNWFEVSLIPATLSETTLGSLAVADVVNLEVDILAKYVESLLKAGVTPGRPA